MWPRDLEARRSVAEADSSSPHDAAEPCSTQLRRIRVLPGGNLEIFPGLVDQAFAEERAADLKHQLDIVLVAELQRVMKALQRCRLLSEFQQGLAQSGESVLMFGVEDQSLLETPAGPRIFFARVVRTDSNVQLYRLGLRASPFEVRQASSYCLVVQ